MTLNCMKRQKRKNSREKFRISARKSAELVRMSGQHLD